MSESAFDNEEEKIPSHPKNSLSFPDEYGTITEYYFMLAETVHYGFMPIIKKGEDIIKMYEQLLEEKDNMSQSHPHYNQMMKEFENIQHFRIVYEIILFDKGLIKEIMNFFKIQYEMIKRWGIFNKDQCCLKQNPPTAIMRLMPEHFLTDITDLVHFLLKHSRLGLKFFSPEDLFKIFEILIVIIRSPKAITNPHLQCKFIDV